MAGGMNRIEELVGRDETGIKGCLVDRTRQIIEYLMRSLLRIFRHLDTRDEHPYFNPEEYIFEMRKNFEEFCRLEEKCEALHFREDKGERVGYIGPFETTFGGGSGNKVLRDLLIVTLNYSS